MIAHSLEEPSLAQFSESKTTNLEAGFKLPSSADRPHAVVRASGLSVVVRLSKVAADHLHVTAESVGLAELSGKRCELTISEGNLVLHGTLRNGDEYASTFHIERPTQSDGGKLLALVQDRVGDEPGFHMPPPTEIITDPQGVRSILRGLVVNEAATRIRAQKADWILRPKRVHEREVEWLIVERGGMPVSPLTIEAAGYSASYSLSLLWIDERDGVLRTTIPRHVERVRRRRMPRVSAGGELLARFLHPTYGHPIECPIVDLSDQGVGLQIEPLGDLLYPAMYIPELVVLRDGRELATLSATVRSVSLPRAKAGLVVHADANVIARYWSGLVRELLHDRTRSWGHSPAMLWDLYEAAGYLNLSGKTPEDFAELRASFSDAVRRLAMAPELGHHVYWPSSRGADAATTNVLTYSRAHLGYHMAKRPGRNLDGTMGKELLREIHWHALEEAMASGQSDWWIGYVQTKTRFSNLLMPEFQARFRDSRRECVVPVHAYQLRCAEATGAWRAALANPQEVEALCAYIRGARPEPYWRSQDLEPHTMGLKSIKQKWAKVGLQRDRVVLVARDAEGQVLAGLVADLGHPGLHLYGLLDLARVYVTAEGGEAHVEALLDAARGWYASHGRKQFMYFHELHEPLTTSGETLDMGTATVCVISMEMVPDLLDYLFEHMSWDPEEPPPRQTRRPSGELELMVPIVEAAKKVG